MSVCLCTMFFFYKKRHISEASKNDLHSASRSATYAYIAPGGIDMYGDCLIDIRVRLDLYTIDI